jgi:hypothetical protein
MAVAGGLSQDEHLLHISHIPITGKITKNSETAQKYYIAEPKQ